MLHNYIIIIARFKIICLLHGEFEVILFTENVWTAEVKCHILTKMIPFALQIFLWKLVTALCKTSAPTEKTANQLPLQDGGANPIRRMVENDNLSEWKVLVTALDRMLFVTYIILTVFCLIFVFPWPENTFGREQL